MEGKKIPSLTEQLREIRNDYLEECRRVISSKTSNPKEIEEFVARGAAAFANMQFIKNEDE